MKIAFHSNCLTVRGTENAIYYYALYNEKLLNNKSIIITPVSGIPSSDTIAIENFRKRFQILYYSDLDEMDKLIENFDIFYCIKFGTDDNIKSNKIKTVIHCVFDMSQPHGQVYTGVSATLARKFNSDSFVPHMIGLNPSITGDNLRDQLMIPNNGIIFGRMGGLDTFDLEIARNAIKRILNDCVNIYFVFVNTPNFVRHPRSFFLDKIITDEEKNKFIITCDAHLECGSLGHSFGISLGEASINNKPCICYNGPMWNTSHIEILGDKGIYFQTENELYDILSSFNPDNYKNKDNNCYREYCPEQVMKKFKCVFLDD